MGDALRMNARKFGQKLAVRDARRDLSYAELNARVNQLAHALLGLGLKKGQNVAVLMGNRSEHVETLYGLAKSGLVSVPMDPKWRGRELAAGLRFFDAVGVVLERSVGPALASALEQWPEYRGPIIWVDGAPDGWASAAPSFEYEALLAGASADEPAVEVLATDLFVIMITSGTTGFPKGCLSTHERYVLSCLLHGTGEETTGFEDTELLVSPLCFNGGRSSMTAHLFWGGTVVMMERFDAIEVLETIQRERITYLALAPVMADRLLDVPNLDQYDTSSLRHLRKSGSPFHPRTVEGLIERVCPSIHQTYASTDAGVVTLLLPRDQLRKSGSAGQVIWAAEAQIVDDQGTPLPVGQVGEIVCRGGLVCSGYYKNPEANAASFRDGWFLTGDLGRFDDEGFLYVVGRKKHMIKSGSISIFPEEIQEVLQAHPRVQEAAVVGVPHPEWGEAVLAVVAPRPGEAPSEAELIGYCKQELAAYKAPKAVRFVDELPHTELGKIATETLRRDFATLFEAGDH